MKVKYYKEDDILVIKLGNQLIDYGEPVSIEVLDASRLFAPLAKALPREVKQSVFAAA